MSQEGRSNITPWTQELWQVMYGEGWTNFAELNPETAAKLGFREGEEVIVESDYGRITSKVKLFQGLHPGILAMSYGQGHWSMGKFATDRGSNPNDLKGVDYDCFTGMSCFFNTMVRVYKV